MPSAQISALAVCEPLHCALAGTRDGTLYVWCLKTGNLLRVLDAHFKALTSIVVVGERVLTAAEDAVIHVWCARQLTVPPNAHTTQPSVAPLYSLSEHTLAITHLYAGVSTGGEDRVLSCSLDRTCRLWDLATRRCLLTVVLPVGLRCCQMDLLETMILAGGVDGVIYRVNLFVAPDELSAKQKDFRQPVGDVVHYDSQAPAHTQAYSAYRGHQAAVTAIEWSLDGSRLISGSEDGHVYHWDTVSHQRVLSITSLAGPIRSIRLMPKYSYLFSKAAPKSVPPPPPLLQKNFQRRVDTVKVVSIVKPDSRNLNCTEALRGVVTAPQNKHHQDDEQQNDDELSTLKTRLAKLAAENESLKKQNADMYRDMMAQMMTE